DEIATPEFQKLLDDLLETLAESGGVGLAAPQVFVSRRVFLAVTRVPESEGESMRVDALINPVLTPQSDETADASAGCLSFPELLVLVRRYRAVRIDFHDRTGTRRSLTLEGFPARVVQHELDHLDGVLTLDRAATTHDIVKASEIEDVRRHRAGPDAG